jgi:phosphoglycolate phosphatase
VNPVWIGITPNPRRATTCRRQANSKARKVEQLQHKGRRGVKACEVKRYKAEPDPLGAKTILREFGLEGREAAMVGDSEVDVQTARNAGMPSVIVNFGFGTHDRAAHPADLYLDRFEELLGLVIGGV